MRIPKNDVPVKVSAPGAVARHLPGFGSADGCGEMAAEYFSLAAGTDIAPLLQGLEADLCQSPHWGYVIEGEITVTYRDGAEETATGGDLFYWPPGHTVRTGRDTDFVLFSPAKEHCTVLDHVNGKLAG